MSRSNTTSASASAACGAAGATGGAAFLEARKRREGIAVYIGEHPFYLPQRNDITYIVKVLRTAFSSTASQPPILCGEGRDHDGFILFLAENTRTPVDFLSDSPKRISSRKPPFTLRQVNRNGVKTVEVVERGVDPAQLPPHVKRGNKLESTTLVTQTLSPDTFRSALSQGTYVGVFIDISTIEPSRFFAYDYGTYFRPYDAYTREVIESRQKYLRKEGRIYDTLKEFGEAKKLRGRINEVLARIMAIEDIGIFESVKPKPTASNVATDYTIYPIISRILAIARCHALNQRLRQVELQFGLEFEKLGKRKIYFYSRVPTATKIEYTQEMQDSDLARSAHHRARLNSYIKCYKEHADKIFAYKSTTASHIAASLNNADMITDINTANKRGHTPLHFAAMNGHATLVVDLLRRGAHITIDKQGCDFISVTHTNKRPDYTKKILDILCLPENNDLLLRVEEQTNLAGSAVEINHAPTLNWLRKRYLAAHITCHDEQSVNIARIKLTLFPLTEMKAFLFDAPASVINELYELNKKHSVIQLAIIQGEFELFKALWHKPGINLDIKTQYGESLLNLAMHYKQLEIARYIMQQQMGGLDEVRGHAYLFSERHRLSGQQTIVDYIIGTDDVALYEALLMPLISYPPTKRTLLMMTYERATHPYVQAFRIFEYIVEKLGADIVSKAKHSFCSSTLATLIEITLDSKCIDKRFFATVIKTVQRHNSDNSDNSDNSILSTCLQHYITQKESDEFARFIRFISSPPINLPPSTIANSACMQALFNVLGSDTEVYSEHCDTLRNIIKHHTDITSPIYTQLNYTSYFNNPYFNFNSNRNIIFFIELIKKYPHFKRDVINKIKTTPELVNAICRRTSHKKLLSPLSDCIKSPIEPEFTMLHGYCMENSRSGALNTLAISPAGVNIKDSHGRTPLLYALTGQNQRIIRTLLDEGADPEITDCEKNNIFHAIVDNSELRVSQCLEFISDHITQEKIDAKNTNGDTPLHKAIAKKNANVARSIIALCLRKRLIVNLEATNAKGMSLFYCIASCLPKLLKFIIKNITRIPYQLLIETHNGKTALQLLLVETDSPVVALSDLLNPLEPGEFNHVISATDQAGSTLLHQMLIRLKKLGKTPFHHPQYYQLHKAITYLLKESQKQHRDKIPFHNNEQQSWLQLAIQTNNKSIIKCALATLKHKKYRDFEPNHQDSAGNTILHDAIAYATSTVTEQLTKQFPALNKNIVNRNGDTPETLCNRVIDPVAGFDHASILSLLSCDPATNHLADPDVIDLFTLWDPDDVAQAPSATAGAAASASSGATASASAGACSVPLEIDNFTRTRAFKRRLQNACAAAVSSAGLFAPVADQATSTQPAQAKPQKRARKTRPQK